LLIATSLKVGQTTQKKSGQLARRIVTRVGALSFRIIVGRKSSLSFRIGFAKHEPTSNFVKATRCQIGLLRWVENLGIGLPSLRRRDDSTASSRRARPPTQLNPLRYFQEMEEDFKTDTDAKISMRIDRFSQI